MNQKPRSVEALSDIYGMRFLVRASLDVPLEEGGMGEHFRIRRALATFKYLLERGARVIILTHTGRDPKNSNLPLLPILENHIPIHFVPEVTGDAVYGAVAHMKEGTALLLENLRSVEGEEGNDPTFAETLASYADFYVNDAFAVSHREHASIVGLPKHLPSFAGILFMEEYNHLIKAREPEHPSLFILGGAKFETKAPLIEKYSTLYTNTFIGGAIANDLFKGKGYEVGASLVSGTDLAGSEILKKENVIIPTDVVAVSESGKRTASADAVASDEMILDVGMDSVEKLGMYIQNAKTILWNGPLGNYEDGYDVATKACAELIANSNAFSIVGGGDTVAAIESLKLSESFGFLSTAGGAMLEFLEHGTLPGIEALPKEE